MLAHLVDTIERRHGGLLHTGNTGTTCLIDVLGHHGHAELLHRMATRTEYPGWGYMVRQGATTIWESWSLESGVGAEDSMIMWGAVDELIWGVLLGIRGPDYYGPRRMASGFAQVEIRPRVVGDLTAAAGSLNTLYGRIAVAWRRAAGAPPLAATPTAPSARYVRTPATRLRQACTYYGRDVRIAQGCAAECR